MNIEKFLSIEEFHGLSNNMQHIACVNGVEYKSNGWCVAAMRTPLGVYLDFEHDIKFYEEDTLDYMAVQIKQPLFLAKYRHLVTPLLDYLQNAPQYGGYVHYEEMCGAAGKLVVDGECPVHAMVHAMRVFLNMRENPSAAFLFYLLSKENVDIDAAFLTSQRMRIGSTPAIIYSYMRNENHRAIPMLPLSKERFTKCVKDWKRTVPTGPTYREEGYTGISNYAIGGEAAPFRRERKTYEELLDYLS